MKDRDLSDFSMLDLFRMELESQLLVISQGLLEMENKAPTMNTLDSLMRAAHSIKGAARMVNVNAAVRIAHIIEDCFVAAQKGKVRFKPEQIDILLGAVDYLHQLETAEDERIIGWHEVHQDELIELEKKISTIVRKDDSHELVEVENELDRQLLKQESISGSDAESAETRAANVSLRVDASRLNRIFSLAGESLVESHRFNAVLNSLLQLKRAQHKLIEEMDDLRSLLQNENIATHTKNQFNRAYTHAIHLRQTLADRMADLDALDRRSATVVERLHKEVMATRMRPFSSLVQPLPRLVRDLGRKLGKEVRLQMSGLATLVDREVLERIDTSLKHLVQNAIDHGIESAQERQAKGKPKSGTISLNVSQSAGMLFIVISDDGAGVNIEKLKKKIVDKKYASASHVEQLDANALLEYLFEPGFSTRSKVSEISGRGVGLDLVKETAETLGGSVFVGSEENYGTRFQLLLPQTVSIMRVLTTTLGGESYGFPLSRIHRILVIDSADVRIVENRVVYDSDQGLVELVHGNQLIGREVVKPVDNRALPVVVLEEQDRQYGVIVESLDGERELSIQRWDVELGDVPGVNSAAIMDDGTLTLIIDTKHMQTKANELVADNKILSQWLDRYSSAPKPKTVFLFERSRTTRERLRRILQKSGYVVKLATNIEELRSGLYEQVYDLTIAAVDYKQDESIAILRTLHDRDNDVRLMILTDLENKHLDDWLLNSPKISVISKNQFKPSIFLGEITRQLKTVDACA